VSAVADLGGSTLPLWRLLWHGATGRARELAPDPGLELGAWEAQYGAASEDGHGGIGRGPAAYRLHRYRHHVSYFRDVEQQGRCTHYLGAADALGFGVHDLRCAASLTASCGLTSSSATRTMQGCQNAGVGDGSEVQVAGGQDRGRRMAAMWHAPGSCDRTSASHNVGRADGLGGATLLSGRRHRPSVGHFSSIIPLGRPAPRRRCQGRCRPSVLASGAYGHARLGRG
jgi:hypothetical protein